MFLLIVIFLLCYIMYEGDDYKGRGLSVPNLCLFKSYEPHPTPPGPASMVVLFEPFNKKWRFPNAVRGD